MIFPANLKLTLLMTSAMILHGHLGGDLRDVLIEGNLLAGGGYTVNIKHRTNRVSDVVRARAPEIEWQRIIRSRHIVVHDYFGVDYAIVWRIIEVHLPPLRASLESLQQRLPSS